MGNFLVMVPNPRSLTSAGRLFDTARSRGGINSPDGEIRRRWCYATGMPRRNGTGGRIATSPATQSWLIAVGTWFHPLGFGVGEESRLLDLLLQTGPEQIANELSGFYVLAYGNAQDQTTTIITDLVGSCHAFVRELGCGVAISGSSLLLAQMADIEPDPVACQEFLHTGVIYEDRSLFQGIRKLPAASLITFNVDGRQRTQVYWSVDRLTPESLADNEAVDQLWNSLVTSAETVSHSFPNIACDLTGGYDSRAVVAAFLGAGSDFSTVVSGAEDNIDVRVSRELATVTGKPHCVYPRLANPSWADLHHALGLTDGECDLLEYASTARTHRELSARYDVSVNGSFGELARGYWWEILLPRIGARRPLDCAKLARLRFDVSSFDHSLIRPEYRLDLSAHLAEVVKRASSHLADAPNTFQMDATYLSLRMHRWQGRIASSTNRLWPCMSLFMFRSCLETMLQAKSRLRTRSLLIRTMLARYQPRLAEKPLEHGYPAVPATWQTLPRFRPLIPYYGTKILHKLRVARAISVTQTKPPRIALWEDERVQETLDCQSMKVAQLICSDSLKKFLSLSRHAQFSYDLEWRRLLSLEIALRAAGGEVSGSDGNHCYEYARLSDS